MKNTFGRKFVALCVVLLTIATVLLSACNDVQLHNITVSYNGGELEVGQSINQDSVTVTASYSDGSSKSVSGFTLSDTSFDSAGQHVVSVTYSENGVTKTATFTVTVNEPVSNPTLTSISAIYTGGDLPVGVPLNQSKVTVTATYSDESSKTVNGYSLSAIIFETTGEQTVTVTYTEDGVTETTTFTVTVVDELVVLERITAEYSGGSIQLGEQPSTSLLTVTAYYSNNSSKLVPNFSCGTVDSTSAGDKNWEISYTEAGVTKTAFVVVTVVDDSSVKVADMSIHFITSGNLVSGDSIYIKAGDTDILIDAGSSAGCAASIQSYVNNYCKDGILEYVIVTHQDSDHIAAFTRSLSSGGGIFEMYQCQTIIDCPLTSGTPSAMYNTYVERRNAEVAAGANHYTALECYNNENGAQRVYQLADGITMEILYHKYYEQKQSEPNNNSVCVLFTQGDNHYLFTGDLEESGEKSLVESNDLPEVQLFKAGHHGSENASNTVLLEVIKPQNVVVSCVAGDKYGFPQQAFINRIAAYTSNVYVTGQKTNSGVYADMNGNVVFSCIDGVIEVHGTNNDTKLKDTDWFKSNRNTPEIWK